MGSDSAPAQSKYVPSKANSKLSVLTYLASLDNKLRDAIISPQPSGPVLEYLHIRELKLLLSILCDEPRKPTTIGRLIGSDNARGAVLEGDPLQAHLSIPSDDDHRIETVPAKDCSRRSNLDGLIDP